jgi:hypothetical protein
MTPAPRQAIASWLARSGRLFGVGVTAALAT